MTTRLCTKCGEVKDISEFSWSIRGVKRHSRCKACHAKERMDYYKRNKGRELKYKWNRQLDKRAIAREYVDQYLAKSCCVDCGMNDAVALTFDHIRGNKKKSISDMVSLGYSLEVIQAEIDKCEVRCFNCHMKVEKERRKK